MSLDVTLVEARGEAPGVMTWRGGEQWKEQLGRIPARDRAKKIELNLRQIVKAVIKNFRELVKKRRYRRLLGGASMEIGDIFDFVSSAEILQRLQQNYQLRRAVACSLAEMAFAER